MSENRPPVTRSTGSQPTEVNEDAHMESNVAAEEQDASMSGGESSVIVEEEEDKPTKEIIELGEDYSESEAEDSGLESYSESGESESEEAEEPGTPENSDSEVKADAESEASEDADSIIECSPHYKFKDANVNLRTENLRFWIHEHMLQGFARLKSKLDRIPWDEEEEWKVITLEDSGWDIQNMLAVIYSKPYEPHDFELGMLESTLKLATKYDHADLRGYAISELDEFELEPIDQFRLGRDYNVPGWRSRQW